MDRKNFKIGLLSTIVALIAKKKIDNKRKFWVKPWILNNSTDGHYENVYLEWRYSDPEAHRVFLRMYSEDFQNLLRAVEPMISKQNTIMRQSIPAHKRLSMTLRFLATGKYLTLKCISLFTL